VQVYTLPGLELVLAQRLEEALTFPWAWPLEPAQLSRLCTTDPTGQLALVIFAQSPIPLPSLLTRVHNHLHISG